MKIRPLGDRALIQQVEAEGMTKSGKLYVPDTAKDAPFRGKVLAVGPGDGEEDMHIATGDEVIFARYGGSEVDIDGEKLLIIRQSDILAVVEDGE